MRRLLFLSTLLPLFAAAQAVKIEPSAVPGIALVGPQSPDFSPLVAKVVGSDQPRNFVAWLPYAVLVQNNTGQVIVGLTARLTCAKDAATPLRNCMTSIANWFDHPRLQLQPGQSILSIPQGFLSDASELRVFEMGRGMANLPVYQQMQRLDFAIDGVVFADGAFVGPNISSAYERYQAEIAVPRNVAAKILELKATSSISDVVAWLTTNAALRSKTLTDFTTGLTGSASRGLLHLYNNHGEAALYSAAQSDVQQAVFPLHR